MWLRKLWLFLSAVAIKVGYIVTTAVMFVLDAVVDAACALIKRVRLSVHWKKATPESVAWVDVDKRCLNGEFPLHLAAEYNGNSAVVEALIKAGAEVNARNKIGETPLHLAAKNNKSLAVVKALLNAGAEVNARDEFGLTPLHRAGQGEDPAIIWALLKAGADINARASCFFANNTPLHEAARGGKCSVVKALLKEGANVKMQNSDDKTPFDLVKKKWCFKKSPAYWALHDAQFK